MIEKDRSQGIEHPEDRLAVECILKGKNDEIRRFAIVFLSQRHTKEDICRMLHNASTSQDEAVIAMDFVVDNTPRDEATRIMDLALRKLGGR